MRIVVLGAGTVGTSVAEMLCQYRHSVTVVDHDPVVARRVNDELDVRGVTGAVAQSSVLFQAGVMDADLCLAVTSSDEGNLLAASMAKAMGARRVVARVYAPVFRDLSTFDYQRHFHIDRLLSLEHLSAMELARKIREPGSLAVENFAHGDIEMQELAVTKSTSAVGVPLKDLQLPRVVRIGSILRGGKLSIAEADDVVAVGDRVTLIGSRGDIDDVKSRFESEPPQKRGIVIAGGGETGYHLARVLEGPHFAVVLLEEDRTRCEFLASHLKQATVVHCDVQRRADLEEERVGSADVFVACTGEDENNIMACVEAKELGAKMTAALVSRPDYANVVEKLGIDETVSPREVVAKQILGFLNSGPVVFRNPLLAGGGVEILEVEVLEGAPITEHVLAKVDLPAQCLVAAVIKESFVQVPGADDRIKPGDTVLLLAADAVVDDALNVFQPTDSNE
ncbi:MAG: Trk system potassium transporter TrkA [Planctomycetaceae bacterium]|nr:Trk system potassium transporter TrkA [Planctomycetaceae bacterium]